MPKLDQKQILIATLFVISFIIGISFKNGQKNSYTIVQTSSEVTNNLVQTIIYIKVHLAGEVYNPGIYTIKEGAKTFELIKMAGGLKPSADTNKVNLVQILKDGQRVMIKAKSSSKSKSTQAINKIDLNTASLEELMSLPKIGEKTAKLIMDYRSEHGGIKSTDELSNIKGIGEKTITNIKPYLLN